MNAVISPVHFPRYRLPAHPPAVGGLFDRALYYQRGTWALAHGLLAIARMRGVARLRILVPAYLCREPIEALGAFPIDCAFYDVDARGMPRWDDVRARAGAAPFDVLLLVHTFGFPNDIASAQRCCAAYGMELVEDCAHVLAPFDRVGTSGVCSVWSPWKFYPVPALGALLVQDRLRPFVDVLPSRRDGVAVMRWRAKREIQRALCALGVNWYRSTRSPQRHHAPLGDAAPDRMSVRTARRVSADAPHMAYARRMRYAALERAVRAVRPDAVLVRIADHPASAPYVFPFLATDDARAVSQDFTRRGIPAFPWPELPDAVRESASYRDARGLAAHVVLLPVHEQVTPRQLAVMCRALPTVLS